VRLASPTVRTTADVLRRSGGKLELRLVVRGVGRLTVTVLRNGRRVAVMPARVVSTGRPVVGVQLPRAAWAKGRLQIRLVTAAPTGRARATTAGTLLVG
jgi:hypothetical protein